MFLLINWKNKIFVQKFFIVLLFSEFGRFYFRLLNNDSVELLWIYRDDKGCVVIFPLRKKINYFSVEHLFHGGWPRVPYSHHMRFSKVLYAG